MDNMTSRKKNQIKRIISDNSKVMHSTSIDFHHRNSTSGGGFNYVRIVKFSQNHIIYLTFQSKRLPFFIFVVDILKDKILFKKNFIKLL